MTNYAFTNADNSAAWEVPKGTPFVNPFTEEAFPSDWPEKVTQVEREAKACWPIGEPSAVAFPYKITSVSLDVAAGPVVTRNYTTASMSAAEKRAAIVGVIDATETAKLNSEYLGLSGSFVGGARVNYPLTPAIRDAMNLYGTLALNAQLGRRAVGDIDFNGQPANNATVTVNGVTITFVTGTPTGNQVQIGATSGDTATALAAFLNTHTDLRVNQADYRKQGTDIIIVTHKTFSSYGNGFTISASSSPNANCDPTPTLSGGRDPAEAADLTWISAFTPHNGEWFEVADVNGIRHFHDAFEAVLLVRDMTFFVTTVTFYAQAQRRAAVVAEAAANHATLQTIWDDVNNSANWDPGTPPTWP